MTTHKQIEEQADNEWPEHLRIREFPILGKEKQGNIQSSNQTSKE